jgi:hypothetical protein
VFQAVSDVCLVWSDSDIEIESEIDFGQGYLADCHFNPDDKQLSVYEFELNPKDQEERRTNFG